MRLLQTNQRMRKLYGDDLEHHHAEIPGELQAILHAGVTIQSGCVFLTRFLVRTNAGRESFPDDTGYECFVNKIHIDEYVDTTREMVRTTVAFFDQLDDILRKQCPDERFLGLVGVDDKDCSIHIHTERPGESFLAGDLEGYRLEAVAVYRLGA